MTAVGGKTELVPKKGVTSSVVWNWFGFAATDADQTSPRCKHLPSCLNVHLYVIWTRIGSGRTLQEVN
ncbi:hypothetical protein MHYP_G00029460 [Metynnis hypsauchen]